MGQRNREAEWELVARRLVKIINQGYTSKQLTQALNVLVSDGNIVATAKQLLKGESVARRIMLKKVPNNLLAIDYGICSGKRYYFENSVCVHDPLRDENGRVKDRKYDAWLTLNLYIAGEVPRTANETNRLGGKQKQRKLKPTPFDLVLEDLGKRK